MRRLLWDTTLQPCEYPPFVRDIFFKESIKNRLTYTSWVGKISKNYKKNLDWWLTAPPSRNPFVSQIHKYLSILSTLEKLKKKINFLEIKLETRGIFSTLEIWSRKNNINLKLYLKQKQTKKISFILILNSIIFNIIIFLYIRLFVKKIDLKKKSFEKKIILVDVFQTLPYVNRNYYGIEKKLKDRSKELFYIPTFVIQKNLFYIFRIINSIKNKNYIFKEHYLDLNDIIFASLHFSRKNKFKKKFPKYKSWDINNLINEEISKSSDFSSAFISLLNYKFFQKISNKKIKISKIINWFENQTVDKGWNYGARMFYPESQILGYQGFTHYSQYMNTIPTKYEEESKVLPKKILTIGKAYKNLKKEFFKKANISVAPALNYQFLFKNLNNKNNDNNNILVVLSGIEALDKKILEWAYFFLKNKKNFKLKIKPHPILPIDLLLKGNLNKLRNKISILSGNLSKALINSHSVVCSGPTSATLESIAYNCFVIIPVLDPCDEINLKSIKIPKDLYSLVYSKIEFSKKLNEIMKKNKKNKKNNRLKKFLFEKLNEKNVKIFF